VQGTNDFIGPAETSCVKSFLPKLAAPSLIPISISVCNPFAEVVVKKFVLATLFVLCASVAANADTVTFKNGDKISGTLTRLTGGNLAMKTEVLGEVTIPIQKVQSLMITQSAVILSKDKKILRGQVELEAGEWKVTANGTSETVPSANVNVVTPAETYHREMEVAAEPWQDWKGQINFGYSIQRGDQDTHTISTLIAATRERSTDLLFMPHFRTNYGLNVLLSRAEQDGERVTSNTLTTSLREDYLVSPANFIFALAELDHADAQGLHLQQSYGGGYGRDLLHTKKTIFSVLGGIDYLNQDFETGVRVSSVEANIGEKLGMQISSRLRLDHHMDFYPDLHRNGQYHFDGAINLGFKINNHLAANAGAIDLYITNPVPGAHLNNIAITTGLGYTF
jgi:putative salt-induced outer membrane protein YdiY